MLPQQLGSSRTSLQSNHLLQTPDSFIRAPLPGMSKATAIIHAGPALGARFTEYTAEMEAGGKLGPADKPTLLLCLQWSSDVEWRNPGKRLLRVRSAGADRCNRIQAHRHRKTLSKHWKRRSRALHRQRSAHPATAVNGRRRRARAVAHPGRTRIRFRRQPHDLRTRRSAQSR